MKDINHREKFVGLSKMIAISFLSLSLATGCEIENEPASSPEERISPEVTTSSTHSETAQGTLNSENNSDQSVELDRKSSHPRREVTVEVTGVEIHDRAIYVTIKAISRDETDLSLAAASRSVFLVDDRGNLYPWQPPNENSNLGMSLGDELTARLGFIGPIDEEAESLTFFMNYDGPERAINLDLNAPAPSFKFEDLPIPGR